MLSRMAGKIKYDSKSIAKIIALLLFGISVASFAMNEQEKKETFLWEEDFRWINDATSPEPAAWNATNQDLSFSITESGNKLAIDYSRTGYTSGWRTASIYRPVRYDLETAETRAIYPYLVLEVKDIKNAVLSVKNRNERYGALLETSKHGGAGLYVFDLRQYFPAYKRGTFDLELCLNGRKPNPDDESPSITLGKITMQAEAPDRVELVHMAGTNNTGKSAVRIGDKISFVVHLSEPANDVTVQLIRYGDHRGFNGDSILQLSPRNSGKMWQCDVDVTDNGTPMLMPRRGVILVKANPGMNKKSLYTTVPWPVETDLRPREVSRSNRVMEASFVSDEPVIDGKLDEPQWKNAKVYKGFTILKSESDKPAETDTAFRILYSDRALYLGVEADEPEMSALKAETKTRDGALLWRDDCIEIFLSPQHDYGDRYHFIVNTEGVLYDACVRRPNFYDIGWNCNWTAKVSKQKDKWTVEAEIPFAAFACGNDLKNTWFLKIARERYVSPSSAAKEYSSWPESPVGFHRGPYADLPLKKADLAKYKIACDIPTVKTKWQGTNLTTVLGLALAGEACRTPKILSVSLQKDGKTIKSGDVRVEGWDTNEKREIKVETPPLTAGFGKYEISWMIRDETNGWVVVDNWRDIDIEDIPVIKARWLVPEYRNSIYATQKIPAILAEIEVAEDLPPDIGVTCELTQGEKSVEKKTIQCVSRRAQVEFQAKRLGAGEYFLTVSVENEGRKHKTTLPLRKLAPPAKGSEVRIENGSLRIDGKPFFPFGWYGQEWNNMNRHGCDAFVRNNYNVTMIPHPGLLGTNEFYVLDSGKAIRNYVPADLKVVSLIHGYILKDPKLREEAESSSSLSEEAKKVLSEAVEKYKDHPSLLAWYLADEPEGFKWKPEWLKAVTRYLDEIDPYHPTVVLNCRWEELERYKDSADILWPDPYEVPRAAGQPMTPGQITKVVRYIDRLHEVIDESRALGKMIGVLPYAASNSSRNAPSFLEIRAQTLLSIIHGARAVGFYLYADHLNFPEQRIGMPYLGREIQYWTPYVMQGKTLNLISSDARIEVGGWTYGDNAWIAAVNITTNTIEYKIGGLDIYSNRKVYILSEGKRQLEINGGILKDKLSSQMSRIYTTDKGLPPLTMLSEIQEKIQLSQKAAKKPGNLAYKCECTGYIPSDRWQYVTDGITDGLGFMVFGPYPDKPSWCEINFGRKVKIGRIHMYGRVSDYGFCIWDGSDWKEIVSASGIKENEITHCFDPVETTKLRIVFPPKVRGMVSEIEAYEQ